MRDELVLKLTALQACEPAMDWVKTLPPETTLQEAWNLCPHAEWLCWLVQEWMSAQPPGGACFPWAVAGTTADAFRAEHACPSSIPSPTEQRKCSECGALGCGCGECHQCEDDVDDDDLDDDVNWDDDDDDDDFDDDEDDLEDDFEDDDFDDDEDLDEDDDDL